jgi:hypothetical protein
MLVCSVFHKLTYIHGNIEVCLPGNLYDFADSAGLTYFRGETLCLLLSSQQIDHQAASTWVTWQADEPQPWLPSRVHIRTVFPAS